MSHGEAGPLIIKIQQTCWPTLWMGKGVCVCVCLCKERNCRFQGSICPWGFQRERTDDKRQRATSRGVKCKKRSSVSMCICVCIHHPACLSVSACVHPPVCVTVCVCARSVKWNGRCCREYKRGPTEVASRHINPLAGHLPVMKSASTSTPHPGSDVQQIAHVHWCLYRKKLAYNP